MMKYPNKSLLRLIDGFLLLVAGCSLFGEDDARARFTVSRQVFMANNFTITFSDGRSQRRFTRADFSSDSPNSPDLSTGYAETATAGSLRVAFTLDQPSGDRIAEGSLQIELRENWSWAISLRTGSAAADPLRGCMGCFGYRAFPINGDVLERAYPSSPDSVYVVWGGNRIDDPVTY